MLSNYFDVKHQKFIEDYQNNPEKNGSFWDSKDCKTLTEIKDYLKNYFIQSQDYTCSYCKQRIQVKHKAAWDLDHIIPKDSHPQFLFEHKNLCLSCKDCNTAKTDKNVLKNRTRKTFPKLSDDYISVHPHFDNYADHISILNSHHFIIPKSKKGIKTIEICGLLRFFENFQLKEKIPIDVTSEIAILAGELQNENSPEAQHFILSQIQDLTKKGIEITKANALGKMHL